MKILYDGVEYNNTQIWSCDIKESVSLISEELIPNRVSFKIQTLQKDVEFVKGEQILCVGDNDENIGAFYIDKSKRIHTDNAKEVYQVECLDILQQLDNYDFLGAYYTGQTLDSVLYDLFKPYSISYNVQTALKSIPIYGYIPVGTLREAVLFIAFSTGVIVDTSRSLSINFRMVEDVTKGVINIESVFSDDIDSLDTIFKASIKGYKYVAPKTSTPLTVLFEDKIEENKEVTVAYEPTSSLSITNGSILKSSSTYAIIKSTNSEEDTILEGKNYTKTEINYISGEGNKTVVIPENTMVGPLNAYNLIDRVLEDGADTHTGNIRALYTGYRAGDRVVAETRFGLVYGRIVEQTIKYSSSLTVVDISIKGKLIPLQDMYYTPNELRTNDQIGVI